MDRFTRRLLLPLVLLSAAPLHAEMTFAVSPSVGVATINNIDNYDDTAFLRLDGSFYPIPQLAIGVFGTKYGDFESTGFGNDIAIEVSGVGFGVTGRWPVHPHFNPYLRAEYFLWRAKATGLDRTLGEDNGGSAGLALGAQFPINHMFGIKTELSGYNDISGANIRQFNLGLTIEF